MILKGMKSMELEKFFNEKRAEILKLEDRMAHFGHTSFEYKCQHGLTQKVVDLSGPLPKEMCLNCGQEVIR